MRQGHGLVPGRRRAHRTKLGFILGVKLSLWRVHSGKGCGLMYVRRRECCVENRENEGGSGSRETNSTATLSIFSVERDKKVLNLSCWGHQ